MYRITYCIWNRISFAPHQCNTFMSLEFELWCITKMFEFLFKKNISSGYLNESSKNYSWICSLLDFKAYMTAGQKALALTFSYWWHGRNLIKLIIISIASNATINQFPQFIIMYKTNFHLTQHSKKHKIKIMSMSCKKNYNTEKENTKKKKRSKKAVCTLYILY